MRSERRPMPFSVAQTAYEWPLGTSNLVHVNKASLSVASTTVFFEWNFVMK
jgi:hypothetical protein